MGRTWVFVDNFTFRYEFDVECPDSTSSPVATLHSTMVPVKAHHTTCANALWIFGSARSRHDGNQRNFRFRRPRSPCALPFPFCTRARLLEPAGGRCRDLCNVLNACIGNAKKVTGRFQ